VLATLFAGLLALTPIHSFDVWWHLRTGALIVSEGRIPITDCFTYTATGRPWITHEWLSEVIFHGLHQLGGADTLVGFKALLAALAVGLGALAGVAGPDFRSRLPAAALAIVLAAPLISPRAFVRPHMITALLLGLTLLALRLESTTGRARWRWVLVPIFLIWANLHSGFLLGLGAVILYWIGDGARGGLWRQRAAVVVAVLIAVLVNPHHVQAVLYPIRLVARPEVRGTIVELRNVFHPAYQGALFLYGMAAAAMLTVVLLLMSQRRLVWAVLLPGLAFWALAVRSVRSVSELAVVAPVLIVAHGDALGRRRPVALAVAGITIGISVIGGAWVVGSGIPMGAEAPRRIGLGVNPMNCPRAAVRFLEATNPPGRIFNKISFGGYIIHELWPEKQVFIDGRLDVFPPEFLSAYQPLIDLGEGWDETVEGYGISLAIVDYPRDVTIDWDLRAKLRDSEEWVCVYFSNNAVVYARDVPENTDLIRRFGSRFDPTRRTAASVRTFATEATAETLDRAIAAIEAMLDAVPGDTAPAIVLGQLFDHAGRSSDAVDRFRRVLAHDPSAATVRLLLAGALRRAGDPGSARVELRRVLDENPERVDALLSLGDVERAAGRREEAIRALERAADIDTENHLVQLRLGVLNAELGRYDEAERHFLRARELRPDDPAPRRNLEQLRRVRGQR
jgi:tetratricopeptide (TPR) repeat protein